MKSIFITLIIITGFISCVHSQANDVKIQLGIKGRQAANEGVATFSEGCFWHAEIVFQSLVGVRDAVSGYAGGTTTDPDYEKVSTGTTGHAETVQVYYDPSKISYETLVKAFFASQDPTQINGQGDDIGTEYRSIAFYRNEKEKQIIESEIQGINDSKKYSSKVATEVVPFTKFYPAEDYHQEYVYYHRDNPYVQNVCIPELVKFENEFKGNFKK